MEHPQIRWHIEEALKSLHFPYLCERFSSRITSEIRLESCGKPKKIPTICGWLLPAIKLVISGMIFTCVYHISPHELNSLGISSNKAAGLPALCGEVLPLHENVAGRTTGGMGPWQGMERMAPKTWKLCNLTWKPQNSYILESYVIVL